MAARPLALCLAAAVCAAGAGEISSENNSEKLARSLRRQLIQNNYDYMSSGGQETFLPRANYRKQHHRDNTPHKAYPPSHIHHKDTYEDIYRQITDFKRNNKLMSKNNDNIEDLIDESTEINSYIDSIDDELKDIVRGKVGTVKKTIPDDIFSVQDGAGEIYKYRNRISYKDNPFSDTQELYNDNNHNMHTTTAKYNIFKVIKAYRRSDHSTLIQGSPGGASVVRAGLRPHAAADGGDLPPLVNTVEDVETGSDEPFNVHAYDNTEAQNISLMITATPDEVLVL